MPRRPRENERLARTDPYGALVVAVVELASYDASKGRQGARRWLEELRAHLAAPLPDTDSPSVGHEQVSTLCRR